MVCRLPSSTWWKLSAWPAQDGLLGLRTLTVIHDTEAAVRLHEPDFRIANLDYDDAATYAMLERGETEGIFQLESTGMTQVLVSMHPRSLKTSSPHLAVPPRPHGFYPDLSAQPQGAG